eukprot:GHVU01022028.1.p1 GENE.GHVU01022028.1~~GHVU01022028.1.p1  ORF type:complete len:138 (-),score=8.33 GHVU01022028.1:6-419(-)
MYVCMHTRIYECVYVCNRVLSQQSSVVCCCCCCAVSIQSMAAIDVQVRSCPPRIPPHFFRRFLVVCGLRENATESGVDGKGMAEKGELTFAALAMHTHHTVSARPFIHSSTHSSSSSSHLSIIHPGIHSFIHSRVLV